MDNKNLINQPFGRWTVIGDCITFKNKANRTERKWLCRCECGTVRYVLERSLIYGGSQSCGCIGAENSIKAVSYDLKGKTFGDLEVLCKAKKQHRDTRNGVWWTCKCSCGNICDVLASLLVTHKTTHCGCKTEPKNYYYKDIKGQTFNRLKALYPTNKRTEKGAVIWHCRCECGNEIDVSYNELVYTDLQSCGCKKAEHNEMMPSFLTHIDGTSLDILKSKKIWANNTTGARGVYLIKGKFVAKLVFQKKAYHLGTYKTFDEAVEARQKADKVLREKIVDYYAIWNEKALSDPEWAKQNPINIKAKKNGNEIDIVVYPLLEEIKRNDTVE